MLVLLLRRRVSKIVIVVVERGIGCHERHILTAYAVELLFVQTYLSRYFLFIDGQIHQLGAQFFQIIVYGLQLVHCAVIVRGSLIVCGLLFGNFRIDTRNNFRQPIFCARSRFVLVYVQIYFVMFEPLF